MRKYIVGVLTAGVLFSGLRGADLALWTDRETGLVTAGPVWARYLILAALAGLAGISEVYLHQVFSGRRMPSRDRLLCICIALELSLEETQDLLKRASYAQLYPRIQRDAIISYGILHHMDLEEINQTLFAENEKTLS